MNEFGPGGIRMSRKRFNRVAWTMCRQCGKSETKIAKSIHGGILKKCCGEWIWRRSRSLNYLNMSNFVDDEQISYGIAWGVE